MSGAWLYEEKSQQVDAEAFSPFHAELAFDSTFSFMVDGRNRNMDTLLLELVSLGGECSVVVVITDQLLGISGLSHVERAKAQQKVPSINIPKLSRLT